MVDKFGIFEVGGRYENRKGPYVVVGIIPPQMRIRYDSGEVIDVGLSTQARIIENMSRVSALSSSRETRPRHSSVSGQPRLRGAGSTPSTSSGHPGVRPQRTGASHAVADLTPGQIYRRRDLHAMYRGQEQGGICTPTDFPIILLFTGQSGGLYGYKDHWDGDDVFHYFGEGRVGDMEFIRGNRAIRDHADGGKEIYLFETIGSGEVQYVSEMTCIGYDYEPNVPDVSGKLRTAIVFRLKPVRSATNCGQLP